MARKTGSKQKRCTVNRPGRQWPVLVRPTSAAVMGETMGSHSCGANGLKPLMLAKPPSRSGFYHFSGERTTSQAWAGVAGVAHAARMGRFARRHLAARCTRACLEASTSEPRPTGERTASRANPPTRVMRGPRSLSVAALVSDAISRLGHCWLRQGMSEADCLVVRTAVGLSIPLGPKLI
jgi:hypothetical protein